MKKRLFTTTLLTLMAVLGIQAYDTGEYAYTLAGRYKVIGDNMIQNGDFSSGFSGWKTAAGNDLSTDFFQKETANGQSYIKILQTGEEASLANTDVMLEAGTTYFITYRVKGEGELNLIALTNATNTANNTQDFFTDADGSISTTATGYKAIAEIGFYNNEWQEIAYTITPEETCFLVMNFTNLLVGDCFSDFGVYAVQNVADDRILKRAVEEAKLYTQIPGLTGQDDLLGVIAECEALVTENPSDINDYVQGLKDEELRFFAQNGADVSQYFSNFTFDNLTPRANANVQGWVNGGRWGTAGTNSFFLTTHACQWIGANYNLPNAALSQEQDLPAGKYLLSINARGGDYRTGVQNTYNYFDPVQGVKMFINNDSLHLADMPTKFPKTYVTIVEVKEGEKVNIGVANTGIDDANYIEFDNNFIFLLGKTDAEVDDYVNKRELNQAKYALRVMIDSAIVVSNYTDYVFGKSDLHEAIQVSEGIYSNSTDIEEMTTQVNAMRSAINICHNLNKEVKTLRSTIDECNGLVADASYKKGKAKLQTAIDVAETFYNAINPEVRDSAAIIDQDVTLQAAREYFFVENASLATPGYITIQNPTFAQKPTNVGADVPGWDAGGLNQTPKSGWHQTTNADLGFETGVGIQYARNTNSHENKYLAQDVSLPLAGTYEFSAQVMAFHANPSANKAPTGVFFFIGQPGSMEAEKIDSIAVFTQYTDGKINSAERFRINITITEPSVIRFGVDAQNNLTASRIEMSGCTVKYFGDPEQYIRDSVAAVVAPVKDSLMAEINAAKQLHETSRNKEQAQQGVSTFLNAIATAQAAYNKEVTTIEELNSIYVAINTLRKAEQDYMTCGVWPASGTCFDLTPELTNADMSTGDTDGWLWLGNQPIIGEQGYMYQYYSESESEMNYTKIYQSLKNMPQGKYQFYANATYRMPARNDFPMDDNMNDEIAKYAENETFYVVANNDSVAMTGLLKDVETDQWGNIISSFNYRHAHPVNLLNGTRFEHRLTFDVTADKKATVGVSVVKPQNAMILWAKEFRLLFWGDKIADGIETICNDNLTIDNCRNGIYDLLGRRINHSDMKKGLYIVNGKKVVIK